MGLVKPKTFKTEIKMKGYDRGKKTLFFLMEGASVSLKQVTRKERKSLGWDKVELMCELISVITKPSFLFHM